MDKWVLGSFILVVVLIISIISMAAIGIFKMKKGRLNSYFVHRMVSGQIWRHIQRSEQAITLTPKVQRLLIASHMSLMTALVFQLIWTVGINQLDWDIRLVSISFICIAMSILLNIWANRAFKQKDLNYGKNP
ncbi:hypothetical protein PWEIH_13844 [Listeria weihenstephanensis FSL R9-0317]|uniref:Uncharacterized protein n=1 Tax=Listeria weihenstephanensis TaxID=1006155 RepID=A0A1S7FTM3_9LIST|nr:hypothetical protein [Listeria weihenstephanensis]AQY50742.1 hypothetical protein UE46_06635 [Listeria weihenstephanensis]EUJ36162.1 hypothetical protein PWEIH_13844 [Listeria weihenstephanensis FSL R9-0317]MBC1499506.1 hypothetical protein [Listeria weihenstephanensis]